jgi:SIR2-like domain
VRFLNSGADIPEELIRGVTSGSVTFLCGAGVSFRSGLPSFKQLTLDIYSELGASPDDEHAERISIDAAEYDRALRSLEKRTRPPKAPSLVRDATARLLKVPAGPFEDHLALLQLSRDADGRPRLLTTNFDTLFERAADGAGLVVPSHTGVSIPHAGGERDFGIMHIHGRIEDKILNLPDSDLVLTSADFGDAYLRSAWASRYIGDRMRVGQLVLVGYSAEDAAFRLLLDALDADRDRFPDLKRIYALERGSPGSSSIWKSKGILAIEFKDYDAIYSTIREWARYAADPIGYRRSRIGAILQPTAGGVVP